MESSSEKKVEIIKSNSLPNTIDIRLNNEGHTAASVIVERLEEMSIFSAYKITHPTDTYVTIRIQSKENPRDVFQKCIESIIEDIDGLMTQLVGN